MKNKEDFYNSTIVEFLSWLMRKYKKSNDVYFDCMTYKYKGLEV
jgi:hypothetical protein